MAVYALTTKDNPFDYFNQYRDWLGFDTLFGYNSEALLARFCYTSTELSESRQEEIVNAAIDRIIEVDPTGMYTKIELKEIVTDDT